MHGSALDCLNWEEMMCMVRRWIVSTGKRLCAWFGAGLSQLGRDYVHGSALDCLNWEEIMCMVRRWIVSTEKR